MRWTQKLALASSLCLTVLMIAFTLVRAVGPTPKPDKAWATYWMIVPSLVGLVLTASTALRALFVSHAHRHARQRRHNGAIATFGGGGRRAGGGGGGVGGGAARKFAAGASSDDDEDVEAAAAAAGGVAAHDDTDDADSAEIEEEVTGAERTRTKAWNGLALPRSLWSASSASTAMSIRSSSSSSSASSASSTEKPKTTTAAAAAAAATAVVAANDDIWRRLDGSRWPASFHRRSDLASDSDADSDIKAVCVNIEVSARPPLEATARDGGVGGGCVGISGAHAAAAAAAAAAAGETVRRPAETVLRGTVTGQRAYVLEERYSPRRGSI